MEGDITKKHITINTSNAIYSVEKEIDTTKWDLGYAVKEEIERQIIALKTWCINPNFISFSTKGYEWYCVYISKMSDIDFTMISDIFGYKVIINPYQIQSVVVLTNHETEFIHSERLKTIRGIK